MTRNGILIAQVAFAVGIGVGLVTDAFLREREDFKRVSDGETVPPPTRLKPSRLRGRDGLPRVCEATASTCDSVFTSDTASTVEVIVGNTSAPSPEILAAHRVRQARRAAASEAKEERRRDFLSNLNLELLTESQRETHKLFVEAMRIRDKTAAEIRRLRMAGEEVSLELQAQLTDAQSVLRADHDAEYRALREAAARAAGLDDKSVRQLMDDLDSVEQTLK